LLIALALGVLLTSQVFVVRSIAVVGNVQIQAADIIALSGIGPGQSIFRIHEEAVRRRFDGIGKISFEGVETRLPSAVTLQVRERVRRVLVNYAGLPTILDEHGYAIEQRREMPEEDLPVVIGLRATSCQVGRQIQSDIVGQVDAMCNVVQELYTLQLQSMVSELYVADLDNMYLMTRSGMRVKIGDQENLPNKFAWMVNGLTALMESGEVSGVLDVSGGSSAVLLAPPEAQSPGR